jgi:capsular exopolysaccharide synthesis family protein
LLIDCDFRKPQMHKLFGVSCRTGLASVLSGEADLKDAIQRCGAVPGLSVLPCGPVPPNPAELLTSPVFADLLKKVRNWYDFVLVDTPPMMAVTDPGVVAARADGVLLVLRPSRNGRPAAERSKEMLTMLGARILGVVINRAQGDRSSGGYGYGYGYGYGEAESDSPETPKKGAGVPGANGHTNGQAAVKASPDTVDPASIERRTTSR